MECKELAQDCLYWHDSLSNSSSINEDWSTLFGFIQTNEKPETSKICLIRAHHEPGVDSESWYASYSKGGILQSVASRNQNFISEILILISTSGN